MKKKKLYICSCGLREVKAALKTRSAAAFLACGAPFILNEAAFLLKLELEPSR